MPDLTPESPQPSSDLTAQPAPVIHLLSLESYAGRPDALPGVSFWPRVAARLIDFGIHYAISFCAGLLFAIIVLIAARLQHSPQGVLLLRRASTNGISLFLAALLGSIALEAFCEGLHGSTPGKYLLGMTVVQEDGTPCRLGPAFIRSFAYLVDGLFFGLVGYFAMNKTPQQQRHGDEWAHTIVCRRSSVAAQNLRGFGQFMMAFLLGAMADTALIMVGLMLKQMA
jgi:uncharacterized RDD family membrane protein YckC